MGEPLPAGWCRGTLDSGQTYWFQLAAPANIQFQAPVAEEQPQAHARGGERHAVALFAWNKDAGADLATDLIFSKGSGIVVVSDQPGQGWLTGRLLDDATTAKTGIFPANFIVDGGGGGGAPAADLVVEGGGTRGGGDAERGRSPDPAQRSRSPDPGGDASKRRSRSPDPGDLRRARSPDPGPNQKALAVHRERSQDPGDDDGRFDDDDRAPGRRRTGSPAGGARVGGGVFTGGDDPLELQKKNGAFVYDEATQVRPTDHKRPTSAQFPVLIINIILHSPGR